MYTIKIKGKENISGFKVTQSIKKSASKLYFFKFDYANKQNELFYFSGNSSSPKLINDTTIYTVYSEDNTYLNLSVYTPFPVAESKGIAEKNRVVLSELIRLE